MKVALGLAAACIAAAATPAHADLEPRVLVIPVEGTAPRKLGAVVGDVEAALSAGAAKTTPNVARATASLDDTAVIVGCDPAEPQCLDSVAAALNVDQILLAKVSTDGANATVDITAITRDAEPVTQQFTIHQATRDDDLATLEAAVPGMLEAGEARKAEKAEHDHARQPPPPPPAKPVVVTSPSDHRPLFVIAGGGGLAVIGGVFWALASSKQHAIDAAPTDTAADLDHLADLEGQARLRATVGNVLVIGGAAVAVGGLVWWMLAPRHHTVEIAPAPTVGGAAVTIGGRW